MIVKAKGKEQIVQIGPFFTSPHESNNTYLFLDDAVKVLIDLPFIEQFDAFETKIMSFSEIKDLTHLLIQKPTISLVNTLRRIEVEGFSGKIITTNAIKQALINNHIGKDILTIEALEFQLFIGNFRFNFLPIQFLPFPQMFMTFESTNNTLLSNTLFSSFYETNMSTETHKNLIFAYHKANMPSSEYLKDPIRRLRQYQIKHILPFSGLVISNDIDQFIEYEYQLDFYNTYQVFKYNDEFIKEFNYKEIINHVLRQLSKTINKDVIIETFARSEFIINKDVFEFSSSTLAGYKLWHGFFEYMYAKRGLTWLTILEPLVKRYHDTFGLELPAIYVSKMVEFSKSKEDLEAVKKTLEDNVKALSIEIEETKDAVLRCPITKLYNQSFLKAMLEKDLAQSNSNPLLTGFIVVQIDQLNDINRKYGKETGDESIRNLAYQATQVIDDKTGIFKQNGPGIIVYMKDVSQEKIEETAVNIRNAIKDSSHFIEKVTASIAMVTTDEINPVLPINEKIKIIFDILDKRIRFARQIGFGEIVDKKTVMPVASEGIILLVDEDDINRNMLYRILSRINFETKMAKSVEEAIGIIDSFPVDIIISEINLSKMDGFHLKRHLNESKEHVNIPFIMVSHNKTLDNIKRGNVLDVDLILEKPIVPEELIGHVKRFREKRYKR